MAISRLHTWSAGEVLLASDLNAEYNNILANASDLVSPFTKAISMGGFALNFDTANTIALTATTNGVSLTGGALNTPQGADIVAAATLNLDTATGNSPDVTGNTGITAVTLSQGRTRLVRFTGTPTITNGASLVVEGGADFTAVAGQYVLFVGYASSVVRCIPFTTPAATQTLTNKTLTAPTITNPTLTVKDANFTLQDDGDATKQAQLQLSGISAGNTRTVTLPDSNITLGDVTVTGFTTGDVKLSIKTVADSGWVLMNDGTIGSATSGGTTRANADTSALFTLLWNNTADADCAVSTGRGANAAADFAANKTIALPKSLGRALAVYGAGAGLTARLLAHVVGEENHALTSAENGAHTHGPGGGNAFIDTNTGAGGSGFGAGTDAISRDAATASSGSGTAHNTMQPTVFLNVMIKL